MTRIYPRPRYSRPSFRRLACFLPLAASLLVGPAHGQQVESSRLDDVRVTGRINPDKTALSSEPAAYPGSTTSITQADIAKLGVTTYGDLLRPITGLNIDNFGNGGLGYGLSLRGFVDTEHGKDIAVFVDHVPINASSGVQANGYIDLNPLLPETISGFDVLRGPIGAAYGNHAFGGTILFATAVEPPAMRLDVSGGSYGTGRVLGLYSYDVSGFRGYGALEAFYTSGYRDNGRDHRENLFNKVSFPLLSGTASLRIEAFDDAYGEPGYLNRAAVESGAISARSAINGTDHGLHQQQNLVFNYAGTGDASWSSTAYVIHNELFRTRSSGGLALPNMAASQRVDGDARVSYGGSLQRNMPIDAPIPALLVAGISLYGDRVDATRFAADLKGNRVRMTQDRTLDLDNPAAFAELQLKPVDVVKVTVGGRFDKFYDHVTTGASDSVPDLDIRPKPGQFSPKGGVAFTIARGVDLYANVARGVKAPSGYDELVFNPDLNVSKIRSYESGIQADGVTGDWRVVVDAWRTDQTGEVTNDPVSGALINFGKTRRQGFDLEGRLRVVDTPAASAAFFANYSYVSARIDGGGPGNDFVTTVPRYTATLGVDASYAFGGHRVSLYAYDSLVGAKHLDTAGQVDSRAYQRISAKLTYGNSAWKNVAPYLTAIVYPTSKLDETTFYSGGVVVTAPKAPVTVIGGVTVYLQ